jgi:hypothetical protein
VAGCCECGDEPSGSCATELVIAQYSSTEAPHMPKQNSLKRKNCLKFLIILYFWMYEIKQYCTKALQRTHPFYVFCIMVMLDIVLTILFLCFICFNVMNARLMMTA